MIEKLLYDIIDGRDVNKMPCSAAKQLVREFYLRLELMALGCRNPKSVEYIAERALKRAGLGYFA
jgi:hypothetical protein